MMIEMKESGITWVGNIPKHWNFNKAKYHFTNDKYVVGIKSANYNRLALTLKGVIHRKKEDNEGLQPNDFNTYQLLKTGELVFKLIDLQNVSTSRVGLAHDTGIVSPAYIILHANNDINPAYAEKFFLMMWHREIFNALGDAGVRSNLNAGDLLNVFIPVPPLKEQNKIADFLDEKCAEIDSISAEIQEQIDTLEEYKKSVITEAVTKGLNPNAEMKDSGIEWIGQIPKGFEIKRIKHIGIYRNGLTYSPTETVDEKDGTLILRSSNVQNGKIVLDDNVYVSSSIPKRLMVQKDDILICSRNGSRELIGKNAIIENDMIASFGAFMMIYRCVSPKYMYYILNSNIFSYYLGSFFTSTINQLTGSNFGNMKIVYCNDISSQNEIVDYLDSKCLKIDGAIEDKQKQLKILDEYKKTLIYEYVTGKKEVA